MLLRYGWRDRSPSDSGMRPVTPIHVDSSEGAERDNGVEETLQHSEPPSRSRSAFRAPDFAPSSETSDFAQSLKLPEAMSDRLRGAGCARNVMWSRFCGQVSGVCPFGSVGLCP
jgi:hypothetical protein